MLLGNVRKLLLKRIVRGLPADARIVLCCAGKYLDWNWPDLQEILAGRTLTAILDDSPEKLAAGFVHGIPARPIAFATPQTVDAVLITSDRMESRMVGRLAPLAIAGVAVIRTARVEHNTPVTPGILESLLADPALDLHGRPEPWKQPLRDAPLGAVPEITNGCNLNCLMCKTRASQRPLGQMSLDLFRHALDEIEAIGCRQISYHTVGEPTIHRQFEEILRISRERGFEVFLSTNGMLLDRFVEALTRWPVATIRLSVDGASRKTYERIRAGGNFDRLLANIRRMHEAIVEHRLPTAMQMNVVLSRENLHEVPLFFDVFGPYIAADELYFSALNSLAAEDREYYHEMRIVDAQERMIPCAPLWEMLYIGYDGRVSACCRDYHGELVVGDITKQSLREIWHGEAMAELRTKHVARDLGCLPATCRTCYGPSAAAGQLITCMIASLRRTLPSLSPAEFSARFLNFAAKLNAAARPRRRRRNGAPADGSAQVAFVTAEA
jgi:radical SAM protein with 4Fe4S-binding SPASM domain